MLALPQLVMCLFRLVAYAIRFVLCFCRHGYRFIKMGSYNSSLAQAK